MGAKVSLRIEENIQANTGLLDLMALGNSGLWRLDVESTLGGDHIITADKRLARMLGFQERTGDGDYRDFLRVVFHPDDVENVIAGLDACLEGKAPSYRTDHRIWDRTIADWRWFSAYGTAAAKTPEGKITRLEGVLQDIHQWRINQEALERAVAEREAGQRELRMERERLSAVIDAAGLGVWEWNIVTGETKYSQGWADIIGRDVHELSGPVTAWEKYVLPYDLAEARKAIEAHFLGLAPYYKADYRMRHKNGSMVWAQDRGRVVERDADGRPVRLAGVMLDITGQRRTELALMENKRQQQHLVNINKIGTWEYDVVNGKTVLSKIYLEALGYLPGEISADVADWEQLLHPAEREIIRGVFARVLRGEEKQFAIEVRLRHKDGHYVPRYDIGRAVEWDEAGRPTRLAGAHFSMEDRDALTREETDALAMIADQKRALEEQMAARTRLLEIIQERLGKLTRQTGREADRAETAFLQNLPGITAPPEAPADVENHQAFSTYLNQALDFLTAQMRWYKAVVDNTPFPIQVISKDLRWLYLNRPALEQAGRESLDELLGRPCAGYHRLCGTEDCISKALGRGKTDFTIPMPDGRVYQGQAAHLLGEEGEELGHIQIMQDVTELREKEREIILARDAAESSARAKSEFLANMSHEVRTPMNAILGLTHLALQTDLTKQQREYLARTEEAAKSLLRVINDILDFSKIEAGHIDMERVAFNLEDVIAGAVNLLADQAQAKGLELIIAIPPKTPTKLVGDPARLGQVLLNLLSNAVKFTRRGEVTVRVSKAELAEGEVILSFAVQDTGIGLTGAQRERLFTAFSQADNSITRRYGGTGLGLAISKRLVEMMGGEIRCESEYGRGSTFGFTARFGVHQLSKSTTTVRQGGFKGLRVLAVDDNPAALGILVNHLQDFGFRVMTAESGLDAAAIVSALEPESELGLLIVDLAMPGIDGLETIRRVRAAAGEAMPPTILMTGAHNRESVLEQAKREGVNTVLAKPLSASTVFDAVMEAMGRTARAQRPARNGGDTEFVDRLKGARILLVEDNEVNRLVAGRVLANAGLTVAMAKNGVEAVEMVRDNTYDLVLMDIQMPEMDGLTATARIRELPGRRDLPIVAMTAHAMAGDREISLRAGMNDHVTKPIDIAELFKVLDRWIWVKKKGAGGNAARRAEAPESMPERGV